MVRQTHPGRRLRLAAAILTAAVALASRRPARADDGLREACSTEISIFCRAARADDGKLTACLERHRAVLLPKCRAALEAPAPAESSEDTAAEGAAGSTQTAAAPAPEIDARLTTVSGTVYLHAARQKPGEFIRAESGLPLSAGDMVRTGEDGSAEIAFDGNSVVEVDKNSDFIVTSLAPEQTEFHLGVGSLVAKIQRLLAGRSLAFRTPTAVAAVRGTELGVSQGEGDEPSRIGVFDEGEVAVSSPKGGAPVLLAPGQETSIARGAPPAKPKPLAVLAPRRAQMTQARRRQAEVKKTWRPQSPQQRRAARATIARRTPVPASSLKNVRPSQRTKTYPDVQKRQAELKKQQQQRQNHQAARPPAQNRPPQGKPSGPEGKSRRGDRGTQPPGRTPATPEGRRRPRPSREGEPGRSQREARADRQSQDRGKAPGSPGSQGKQKRERRDHSESSGRQGSAGGRRR